MLNYNTWLNTCKSMKLKNFIRYLRKRLCMTQREYAEHLKINRSLLQKYEYGQVRPKPERLHEIICKSNFALPAEPQDIYELLMLIYYSDFEAIEAEQQQINQEGGEEQHAAT